MKSLSEEAMTALLKENGAFFAFSDKQFNEQKKEGVQYVNVFAGLVCPKDRVDVVLHFLKSR